MNKTFDFQIKYKAQGYTEHVQSELPPISKYSKKGYVLYMKYISSEQFKFEST